MKVDIIIPNYNGADLFKRNLSGVLSSSEKYKSNIIIVDDASNQNEFSELEKIVKEYANSRIKLISNKLNLGFSATVNRGVSESDADYVVLLNSDISVTSDFLKSPIEQMESNQNLFGIGFMDLSYESDKIIKRGRGIGKFKRGFLVHRRGEVDKSDTLWISGGSCIVRKNLFVSLGGFDSLYSPFYWEDIDLSYRAQKVGYEIRFDAKSVVEHRHEEGAIKKNFRAKTITKIAYRNQFLFVWKNITDKKYQVLHLLWLPYHIFRALIGLDSAFFMGFIMAILKLPRVLVERGQEKKKNRRQDCEII